MMFEFSYFVSLGSRALLLFTMLIASVTGLCAQQDGPPPDGPPPGMQRDMSRGPSVDRELRRLTQLLTLTDAQQAQVKTLLTEQKQQMDALRKSAQAEDGNPDTDREKMQAVRAATDSKIEALLSDDQKSKYAAWQEQRKAAMERNRRGQEDQPPPPPVGGPPPGF